MADATKFGLASGSVWGTASPWINGNPNGTNGSGFIGGGSMGGAMPDNVEGYGGTTGGTNQFGEYIPPGYYMDTDGVLRISDPAVAASNPAANAQTPGGLQVANRPGAGPNGQNGGRRGIDDFAWGNIAQPSAYEYGGQTGMAAQEEQRYAGLAGAADNRTAPQMADNTYGQQYGQNVGLLSASRGEQQYGLGQLQGLINGTGPSVAQQQMNQGLAQAMQQQASIAASARGGGANLAAAQQAAANAAAGLSGNAVQQGALLRAQEQMNAINAYGSQANALRASDQQQATLSGQMANQQAALDLQNRSANDSRNLAYEQMRRGVFQDQMQARQSGEALNAGVVQQQADRSQRADEAATAERDKLLGTGAAIVGAGIGTLASPGAGTAAGAAAGKAAASAVSDVRAKKNIGDGSEAIRQTMAGAAPYTYDYKNPQQDGQGRRIGVMAQDLERGPLGSQVVRTGPDGKKVIDGPRGLGLALASSADQEKRLQAIEGRLGLAQAAPPTSTPESRAGEAELMRRYGPQNEDALPAAADEKHWGKPLADDMNSAYVNQLSDRLLKERRPLTKAEYDAVTSMPSTPEVDLFRQRPEFQGYGAVRGFEPFPRWDANSQAAAPSGLASAMPPVSMRGNTSGRQR